MFLPKTSRPPPHPLRAGLGWTTIFIRGPHFSQKGIFKAKRNRLGWPDVVRGQYVATSCLRGTTALDPAYLGYNNLPFGKCFFKLCSDF